MLTLAEFLTLDAKLALIFELKTRQKAAHTACEHCLHELTRFSASKRLLLDTHCVQSCNVTRL